MASVRLDIDIRSNWLKMGAAPARMVAGIEAEVRNRAPAMADRTTAVLQSHYDEVGGGVWTGALRSSLGARPEYRSLMVGGIPFIRWGYLTAGAHSSGGRPVSLYVTPVEQGYTGQEPPPTGAILAWATAKGFKGRRSIQNLKHAIARGRAGLHVIDTFLISGQYEAIKAASIRGIAQAALRRINS